MPDTEETDPRIAALLVEREGYVLRGLANRVAEVDATLKGLGFKGRLDVPEERTTRARKG